MVKMLIVLVSTISVSMVFLVEKGEWLLQMQKLHTYFSKNISIFCIFNDQNFNDTLTNVSLEQLGSDFFCKLIYLETCLI